MSNEEHDDEGHERWLKETLGMIMRCATSLDPLERVSLTPASCAAMAAELAWMRTRLADCEEAHRLKNRERTVAERDFPALLAFHSKHALPSLECPSCLVCGKPPVERPPAIRHMELPNIIVCTVCCNATRNAGRDAQEIEEMLAPNVPSAFQNLKQALVSDPEYAWSVHCNLAMPIMDSTKVSANVANRAGAALMKHLFDIDIMKNPNWQGE